jgi:hypothetical protein
MKNIKIPSPLFLFSLLLMFFLTSFNSMPQQTCSKEYIMSWTNNVNSGKVVLRGQLPGFENCVRSLNSNSVREEFVTDAYAVLGKYYLSNNDITRAREYRRLVAEENRRK